MGKILISGHICIETTLKIEEFPINYCPINYCFNDINSTVSGVGLNIAKALNVLNEDITILSLIGDDDEGARVENTFLDLGIKTDYLKKSLSATCQSVILYDKTGKV